METPSGRLSTGGPNIQQNSPYTVEGDQIRSAFTAQRSESHIINISPKKGPIDSEYLIGLGAVKYRCYAASLAQAKQRAIEHFKPKKKDRELVWARAVS